MEKTERAQAAIEIAKQNIRAAARQISALGDGFTMRFAHENPGAAMARMAEMMVCQAMLSRAAIDLTEAYNEQHLDIARMNMEIMMKVTNLLEDHR